MTRVDRRLIAISALVAALILLGPAAVRSDIGQALMGRSPHRGGFSVADGLFPHAHAAEQLSGERYSAKKSKKSARETFDRFLPIEQLEPPRNVPAAAWTSLYCSRWDDGCTRCERESAKDPPTCAPIAGRTDTTTCVPKTIACSEANQLPGRVHCATAMYTRPIFDGDQNIVGYNLGKCDPGRCEGGRNGYFANPEHAKIIESYRTFSKGIWIPTDRPSSYCIGSYRDICRIPSMKDVIPCRSM